MGRSVKPITIPKACSAPRTIFPAPSGSGLSIFDFKKSIARATLRVLKVNECTPSPFFSRSRASAVSEEIGCASSTTVSSPLATGAFVLMNQLAAKDVAVELRRGAEVAHHRSNVRGVLDAKRMMLAPELIGPCGLEARVDGV